MMFRLILILALSTPVMAMIPSDFSSLSELCPDLIIRADYAGPDNFTGETIPGYLAPKAYLARIPAQALCRAQQEARKRGLTLVIFDAYRPAKAVRFFQEWAQRPETNPEIKQAYYPKYSRLQLFEQGYIAARSGHSRGSAVDLTLADATSGKELDMGTRFDFFDELSHTIAPGITALQRKNRRLLLELMQSFGFRNYSKEWWHYSYRPEPYPDHYFDFDVE
jgi:zinc D-Ala-D-Ala dipeptidase